MIKQEHLLPGSFCIAGFQVVRIYGGIVSQAHRLLLEKFSNHPIAKAIAKEWKVKDDIRWTKVEEVKGLE